MLDKYGKYLRNICSNFQLSANIKKNYPGLAEAVVGKFEKFSPELYLP